jgi:hypothetical protein
MKSSPFIYLRAATSTWVVAAILPLPVLVMTNPDTNADIACLYLGLGSAWLASAIARADPLPQSRHEWNAKLFAIIAALLANVTLFITFGLAAGVHSALPFPAMAVLSITPAIGLVPWLSVRCRAQYVAMLLAALIVGGAKLAGCVVARIVYGPDYIEQGYVSADWHTAKLMIRLFWSITVATSIALLIAGSLRFRPNLAAARS